MRLRKYKANFESPRPGPLPGGEGETRGGFSLIEVVAVIGVSAGLFVVVSVLLAGVLQASAGNTAALAWQQTFQRLSQDWRDDVHAASEVISAENVARLGDVEYRAGAEETICIEHLQKDARQRESFRLPAGSEAAFVVDEEAGFATIRITSSKRTITIVAAIGLDLRYAQEASP